jgi:hypothetical protein
MRKATKLCCIKHRRLAYPAADARVISLRNCSVAVELHSHVLNDVARRHLRLQLLQRAYDTHKVLQEA